MKARPKGGAMTTDHATRAMSRCAATVTIYGHRLRCIRRSGECGTELYSIAYHHARVSPRLVVIFCRPNGKAYGRHA